MEQKNMTAYYNEHDRFAAAWLRELIKAGHVAPGVVDERSIEDVTPDDLRGFSQCHFFAGIGGWSLGLRLAGWPDSKPVWTGSCPCQPFSTAGKGAGFDDDRHLWPSWNWLIRQCRPATIFGEQVASKATLPWFDLVQTDLEAMDYAFGCVPFPAAGVGSPHLRDRAYWVADSEGDGWGKEQQNTGGMRKGTDSTQHETGRLSTGGSACRLANPETSERRRSRKKDNSRRRNEEIGRSGLVGRLANVHSHGRNKRRGGIASIGGNGNVGNCATVGLADTAIEGSPEQRGEKNKSEGFAENCISSRQSWANPTNGQWRDVDWLFCRDGKWRPVEPGTFPLVNGVSNRVGRLCGYGNAIVPEQAKEFITAFLSGTMTEIN